MTHAKRRAHKVLYITSEGKRKYGSYEGFQSIQRYEQGRSKRSVFRTSDAFLVEKICLCGITSTPPQPEIHKTALGAEFSVEWQYYEETQEAVKEYKEKGYHIFSIEQVENSIKLPDLQLEPDGKYVVILGNEVKGVQQEIVDMSDDSIEIPQLGTKHSLNVSVTSGIIIWSFFEKMRKFFL